MFSFSACRGELAKGSLEIASRLFEDTGGPGELVNSIGSNGAFRFLGPARRRTLGPSRGLSVADVLESWTVLSRTSPALKLGTPETRCFLAGRASKGPKSSTPRLPVESKSSDRKRKSSARCAFELDRRGTGPAPRSGMGSSSSMLVKSTTSSSSARPLPCIFFFFLSCRAGVLNNSFVTSTLRTPKRVLGVGAEVQRRSTRLDASIQISRRYRLSEKRRLAGLACKVNRCGSENYLT